MNDEYIKGPILCDHVDAVDIEIVGKMIGGTFSHEEFESLRFKPVPCGTGDILVYGSHDFPSHRIAIKKANVKVAAAQAIARCFDFNRD